MVGFSGLIVNLATLTALLALSMAPIPAIVAAIAVSMVSNFLLNRRFTFSYARTGSIWRQFVGFVAACGLGAVVNFAVTSTMVTVNPDLLPQVAAVCGVVAGTAFNFVANRYLVFRRTRIRAKEDR